MHVLKTIVRWLLMLTPLLLLGWQVALLPQLVSNVLYLSLALIVSPLPVIFRSKANTFLYWLLWVVLIGASACCTYGVFVLHGIDEMVSDTKVEVTK